MVHGFRVRVFAHEGRWSPGVTTLKEELLLLRRSSFQEHKVRLYPVNHILIFTLCCHSWIVLSSLGPHFFKELGVTQQQRHVCYREDPELVRT